MKPIRDKTSKRVNWKLIFIIYADLRENTTPHEAFETPPEIIQKKSEINSLSEVEHLFETIKAIPRSKNLSVYILYNRILLSSESIDDRSFILTQGRKGKNNTLKIVKAFDNRNFFQKPALLAKILKDLNEKAPSLHNFIITWGHGSVFGVFKEENPDTISPNKIAFSKLNAQKKQEVFLRNVNFDTLVDDKTIKGHKYFKIPNKKKASLTPQALSKENLIETLSTFNPRKKSIQPENQTPQENPFVDILTNDELGNAIRSAFKKQKIDIIAMMNCAMQNIFTCFSLENVCKILIAPIGSISFPGYNYIHIANTIIKKPAISIESLAVEVTTSINNNISLDRTSEWAVFAADLSHTKSFLSLTNRIADTLIDAMNNDFTQYQPILGDLRGLLNYYDTENYITDLAEFKLRLSNADGPRFLTFDDNVKDLLSKLFLPNPFLGSDIAHKTHLPTGSGILYPQSIDKFFKLDDDVFQVFFNDRHDNFLKINNYSSWINFLDSYFRKVNDQAL